jgi:hypothetical protein
MTCPVIDFINVFLTYLTTLFSYEYRRYNQQRRDYEEIGWETGRGVIYCAILEFARINYMNPRINE